MKVIHEALGEHIAQLVHDSITRKTAQIFLHGEKHKCPRSGRGESLDDWQSLLEQQRAEIAMPIVSRSAQCHPRGPECPGVAVLGALALQPFAPVAHEIAKPAGLLVKSIPHKSKIGGRKVFEVLLRDAVGHLG